MDDRAGHDYWLDFLSNNDSNAPQPMEAIRAILAANSLRPESMEIGDSVFVEPDTGALMPLVIEKVAEDQLSIGHYFRQSGDVVSDPEVVFKIHGDQWHPIRYVQHPDIERHNPDGLELGRFVGIWDQNFRRQGYLNYARKF